MNKIVVEHLSLEYVSKRNHLRALNDISLTVEDGSSCAIIGPSGCGKSTLLRVLAGLDSNYQGSVLIDGGKPDNKRVKTGFIPQNYGLLPWKTVENNILLGLKIRRELQADTRQRMEALMDQLGLSGLGKRYPNELSGGQQQRVSLARAFLLQPDLLLMDEPFSALDAITREEMQDVFLNLWQKFKVTTVFITHYVEEALYLGQKLVIMSPGRIERIMDNPLFGSGKLKENPEFFQLSLELRNLLKQKGVHHEA